MNADPSQRPTASELELEILDYWKCCTCVDDYFGIERFGYKGTEIKAMFEEADKEIPNISISYEKDLDAVYTSRVFTFDSLPKPVNSSIITSQYLNEDNKGTMYNVLELIIV